MSAPTRRGLLGGAAVLVDCSCRSLARIADCQHRHLNYPPSGRAAVRLIAVVGRHPWSMFFAAWSSVVLIT